MASSPGIILSRKSVHESVNATLTIAFFIARAHTHTHTHTHTRDSDLLLASYGPEVKR